MEFKLENFEGPLDLLFHLMEKHEVDIYDIPIAMITQQYLDYMEKFDEDMENMSEFLVMAATLIKIKSKMLIPLLKEEEPEEDPREDLIQKLLEYKKIKMTVEYLKEREEKYNRRAFKEPIEVAFEQETESLEEVLEGVDLRKLFELFKNAVNSNENKKDKMRLEFKSVKRDVFKISDKMEYVEKLILKNREAKFSSLFNEEFEKMEAVVTFLAILELIKVKKVKVKQKENFEDIFIEAC
ncbi:MAG: segregation/condensation protein A [Clostridia bacterium]|jgi:segregation and condensation protein A|nr:segregation/condensation protein A [Clostridia bacterium]